MRLQLRTLGFVVAASLMCATVNAAVINVPADFGNIQDAINAAISGDVIVVAPGTYNEAINFMGKAITVRSSGGPEVTIIDGTGLNDSVVKCISGEGSDSVLCGFTITGGTGNTEVLLPQHAYGGGMINANSSSPTVTDCIFTGNVVGFRGGGMANFTNSNPTVTNCTFKQNTACDGGGMFNASGSSPVLTNCVFSGNILGQPSCMGSNNGGGMRNEVGSNPIITNCTFVDNVVNGTFAFGGAMVNFGSSPRVINSKFRNNTVQGTSQGAGGIANFDKSRPVIVGSLFCENTAEDIFGDWIDGCGNEFPEICPTPYLTDLTGPAGVPDGCVDAYDLAALLAAWCSVAGGNPCGTCFP